MNMLITRFFSPLCWLSAMPPVEQRPKLDGFIRFLIFADYDRRLDETYIYYKTFVVHLWLNAFFMLIFFSSFAFHANINFGYFEIIYRADAPVDSLIYSYPRYVFPLLAGATVVYSLFLLIAKTNYFSRKRVITEEIPTGKYTPSDVYKRKPIAFLVAITFLIATGSTLWTAPDFCKHYYFYVHDFSANSTANFLIFSTIYFVFYQTVYCQFLVASFSYLTRSILRNYVYGIDTNNAT